MMRAAAVARIALYVGLLPHTAAGAKRHPNAISSMEEFWWFIGTVYALLLLPVVLYFLCALAKDPAARDIPPLVGQWAKRKLCGFLSSQRSAAIRDREPTSATAIGSSNSRSDAARPKQL